MKYYAVAQGLKTGIFTSWPVTQKLVTGVPNAVYKSFKTRSEAEAFLKNPHFSRSRSPRKRAKTAQAAAPIPDNAIKVYTDGGAIGNPGPGGYGVVIQDHKELSGGFCLTTNNRMELTAVIEALKALKEETRPIVLYSDSKYVVDGITRGWARNWKKKNWIKSNGEPAANPDLWATLLELLDSPVDVTFQWVKGHAGNPLNERCDALANGMARTPGLPEDHGYRSQSEEK